MYQDVAILTAIQGASFEVLLVSSLVATLANLGTTNYEWYQRQNAHGSHDDIGRSMIVVQGLHLSLSSYCSMCNIVVLHQVAIL